MAGSYSGYEEEEEETQVPDPVLFSLVREPDIIRILYLGWPAATADMRRRRRRNRFRIQFSSSPVGMPTAEQQPQVGRV